MTSNKRKLNIISLIISLVITVMPAMPARAAVGPQGEIGPTGNVGLISDVGPQGEVGPASANGSHDSIDQTAAQAGTAQDSGKSKSNEQINNPKIDNQESDNDSRSTSTPSASAAEKDGDGNREEETFKEQTDNNSSGEVGEDAENAEGDSDNGKAENQEKKAGHTGSEDNIRNDSSTTQDNQVKAVADTGNNQVGKNSVAGNINTGAVNGAVNTINVSGSDFADNSSIGSQTLNAGDAGMISLTPSGSRVDLFGGNMGNLQTGAQSLNQNEYTDDNLVRVLDEERIGINNNFEYTANTGLNELDRNTVAGNLHTGDINLGVNLVNLSNLNRPDLQLTVDVWTLYTTNPDSVIDLSNAVTGINSGNQNELNQSNLNDIQVTRQADVSNQIKVIGNTGENVFSENTVAGDLTTGQTKVEGNVVDIANTAEPMFYLVNVFGEWDGEITGIDQNNYLINRMGNQLTGADSQNNNSFNQNSSTQMQLVGEAKVDNSITIKANTGRNQLSQNTQVGNVETGSIKVMANVVNVLNGWGKDLRRFGLGIINIFGSKAKTKSAAAGDIAAGDIKEDGLTLPENSTFLGGQEGVMVDLRPLTNNVQSKSSRIETVRGDWQKLPEKMQPFFAGENFSLPKPAVSAYPSESYRPKAAQGGLTAQTNPAIKTMEPAKPEQVLSGEADSPVSLAAQVKENKTEESPYLPLLALPGGLGMLWVIFEVAAYRARKGK